MSRESEILEFSKKYAKKSGFELNPNKKMLNAIIKGLRNNEIKFGHPYCPCRPVTQDIELDRPKICPCIWHKDEIKEMGHCLCQFFMNKKYAGQIKKKSD